MDIAGRRGFATVDLSGGIVQVSGRTFFGIDGASKLRMTMRGNAQLITANLSSNRGGDLHVTIKEQAKLDIAGGFEFTSGTIRVEGTQADLSAGVLNLRGTYNPVFNAAGVTSVFQYESSASLGGRLQMEFDGAGPALGDSYTIAHGPIVATGNFDQITGGSFGPGVKFEVRQSAGDVNLVVENVLTLKINTVAGTASMTDFVGGEDVTSYVITSKSGLLNTAGWKSMEGAGASGFEEATPRGEQISELNLLASKLFGAGEVHDLGQMVESQLGALPFGTGLDADEFSLSYFTADGLAHTALLDVTSMRNNLVLTVDTATGMAVLRIIQWKRLSLLVMSLLLMLVHLIKTAGIAWKIKEKQVGKRLRLLRISFQSLILMRCLLLVLVRLLTCLS